MMTEKPKVLNFFDHAFVINAVDQTDRLQKTEEALRFLGIEYEHFPAITYLDKGVFKTPGQRGCAASHLQVVKLAQKRNYKNVLIFEDDIMFRKNFLRLWKRILPQMDEIDYDLFYFYHWQHSRARPKDLTVIPIDETLCTHAYSVNSNFFSKFIEIYESDLKLGKGRPADRIFNKQNSKTYGLNYSLIGQIGGISTVNGQLKRGRFM